MMMIMTKWWHSFNIIMWFDGGEGVCMRRSRLEVERWRVEGWGGARRMEKRWRKGRRREGWGDRGGGRWGEWEGGGEGKKEEEGGEGEEKDELAENVAENIPSFDHLVIVNFKVFRQISISPIYSNLLVVMVVTVSQEFLEFLASDISIIHTHSQIQKSVNCRNVDKEYLTSLSIAASRSF